MMTAQSTPSLTNTERYLAIRNITLVGVVINVTLTIVQLIFGYLDHSQALMADGLHTFSDLVSDTVVLIAAQYSSQQADKEHPYGHARFETFATVIVGGILIIVAAGIFLSSIQRLQNLNESPQPTVISLTIAVIAILSKEMLYHLAVSVAKRVRSEMVLASAWHHRSDALSSVIVVVGVGGAMAGLPWLDAVAAISVSVMIAHIGWSLSRRSASELVDTGLESHKVATIKEIIGSVDGVRTLHDLRTRSMGTRALVDVHLLVNPRISVSEGHQIGETVRTRLVDQVEEISDVIIHIDPENDETHSPSPNLELPLRREVIGRLKHRWQSLEAAQAIHRVNLHYLAGKLMVEIYLPLQVVTTTQEAEALAQRFVELAAEEPQIYTIKVYYG